MSDTLRKLSFSELHILSFLEASNKEVQKWIIDNAETLLNDGYSKNNLLNIAHNAKSLEQLTTAYYYSPYFSCLATPPIDMATRPVESHIYIGDIMETVITKTRSADDVRDLSKAIHNIDAALKLLPSGGIKVHDLVALANHPKYIPYMVELSDAVVNAYTEFRNNDNMQTEHNFRAASDKFLSTRLNLHQSPYILGLLIQADEGKPAAAIKPVEATTPTVTLDTPGQSQG